MAAPDKLNADTVEKKKPYHHGDLRREIIVKAVARARAEGESAIVLREIAGEIGVSATAAYRHFTNRQQLVEEVAIRGFVAMGEALQREHVSGAEANASLAAYLDFRNACLALVEFTCAERPWARMMLENLGKSAAVAESSAVSRDVLQALIDRGIAAGTFAQGASLMEDKLYWAGIDGLCALLMFKLYPGDSVQEVLGDTAGIMVDLCTANLLSEEGRAMVAKTTFPADYVSAVSEVK